MRKLISILHMRYGGINFIVIKRKRPKKKTDNQITADWLIRHRWNSLNVGTKQAMPTFVENAVMSAVYIVAGTSNGQVNISPKLVFRCLMLRNISVDTVSQMEVGYDISERHARRLAQVVRFALDGIKHQIQEYESNLTPLEIENKEMESQFIKAYYTGETSSLYSEPLYPLPNHIKQLYFDGDYLAYGEAVRAFRQKN